MLRALSDAQGVFDPSLFDRRLQKAPLSYSSISEHNILPTGEMVNAACQVNLEVP